MKNKISFLAALLLSSLATFLPLAVSAHENYVLTKSQINGDIAAKSPNVFSALLNPVNLKITIAVGVGSIIAIILFFLFEHSNVGRKFDSLITKLDPLGHVILRVALAVSLLASANFNSFLGPEIPLSSLPQGIFIKYALYALGLLMLFGVWSELVGAASLAILLVATWVYKDYMATYFNYFGEFIALIIFGSRVLSLDRLIYGAKKYFDKYRDYELALIRITYGVSVIYPAITYKLIHPEVIIDIVHRYNLTQFHWLFPHDPLLISLGTGLAQVAVGIFIILGFETRLSTLITFILMTLSVLYFKEAVWPHYILLALALYLIINNGGNWSLDHFIETRRNKIKNKFLRKLLA